MGYGMVYGWPKLEEDPPISLFFLLLFLLFSSMWGVLLWLWKGGCLWSLGAGEGVGGGIGLFLFSSFFVLQKIREQESYLCPEK